MSGDLGNDKQSAYRLEYASSSRAKCSGPKPCSGSKIEKGQLRLGTVLDYNGNKSFKWRHWGCTTARILFNFKNLFETADEIDGFDDLMDEDKDRVRTAWTKGHVADEDIPLTARDGVGGAVGSRSEEAPKREEMSGLQDDELADVKHGINGLSGNNQADRAASLSRAAESLARAAAKLSEAARAMSLVAGILSQGNSAKPSGTPGSSGKTTKPAQPESSGSNDVVANEDEGVGLPQPYRLVSKFVLLLISNPFSRNRLLLDNEADVLLVLCSIIYDLPKVVCYFPCSTHSLKLYKSLIDGVTSTNSIIADPLNKSSIDQCYAAFLKATRSILLLSETDVPSTPAKEVSEYTVIHVGWPVSRRQYVAQRRAHHASTNLLLAYSGDKDLYPSGSLIISQTAVWPGDTGGFRASVDIFRPLFEEGLSEVSFELKEEAYMDWIHVHSRQGPRSVGTWTPSTLVKQANQFILGPLAYKSPRSLVQGSTLQKSSIDLLPEVPAEFVTQHELQPAVDEGLLRVESDTEGADLHELGAGANSANQSSAEDTRPHSMSEAPLSHSMQSRDDDMRNNHTVHHASAPIFFDVPPVVSGLPSQFELKTGHTYFALDEEFDSLPLLRFLSDSFQKTVFILEGTMLKKYRQLFHKLLKHGQQIFMIKPDEGLDIAEDVSHQFVTCTSPATLLIDHNAKSLPKMLNWSPVGCWIYWAYDMQVPIAERFRSYIGCQLAAVIVPSSRRDRLFTGISGFKEHPQSSLILARGNNSLLESARDATRAALVAVGGNGIRGLYSTRIISLMEGDSQAARSAQDAVGLANHYAARVLLHGSREDGSVVFPPIAQRPWVAQETVKKFKLQRAIDAGFLSIN